MRIGSLFSGIGGLELGLEWAGLGHVVWQVEKSEFCRRKLAVRYPHAIQFEDVRTVGRSVLPDVDLICGGFPCQDVSSAGRRVGLSGARSGLWYEFARIVDEMRPEWVVIENVRSGAAKYVDPVRRDLERLGYGSLPVPIAAADCGAPHPRARVFILARQNADLGDHELGEQPRRLRGSRGPEAEVRAGVAPSEDGRPSYWAAEPPVVRVVHGFPNRMDYERALGNAVVPQCAQIVGVMIKKLDALAIFE